MRKDYPFRTLMLWPGLLTLFLLWQAHPGNLPVAHGQNSGGDVWSATGCGYVMNYVVHQTAMTPRYGGGEFEEVSHWTLLVGSFLFYCDFVCFWLFERSRCH